jgi:hypothetical protein
MSQQVCQGDVGAPITAVLKAPDSTGLFVVIPLDPGNDVVTFTFFFGSGLRIVRTCTITDGPNGEVQYTPITGDIPLDEDTARIQAQIVRASPAQNICTNADLDGAELQINRKY